MLDEHAEGRWRMAELTVNYRTPAAVMDLATSMLRRSGQPVRAPRSAREGEWPPDGAQLPDRDLGTAAKVALAAVADHDTSLGNGGPPHPEDSPVATPPDQACRARGMR